MRLPLSRRARVLAAAGVLALTGAATTVVGLAPAAVAAPAGLSLGTSLSPGSSLVSPAGGYQLSMQSDGNLVLYTDTGIALWSSGTAGRGPSSLVLQGDGNLVAYTAGGVPTWWSGTAGSGARQLVLQDDGNLVAYAAGRPAWCTCALPFVRAVGGPAQLSAGGGLLAGDTLRSGSTTLAMQTDGNLVLYGSSGALWWSGTTGAGFRAILQGDGNLVVYGPDGRARWTTGTSGSSASTLAVGTDGSLRLTTASGALVWAAGAATPSSIAADVLTLLNRQRAVNGLPALTTDPRLTAAAAAHNRAMSNAGTMSHQLPGEPDLGTRISATGYAWRYLAENIGWTTDRTSAGAQQMQNAMYNEVAPNDGHRQNILSRSVTQVGVDVLVDGRGKLWLTTDFGQPR